MKRLTPIGTALGLLLCPVLMGFQPPAPAAPPAVAPLKVETKAEAPKTVERWYALRVLGKRAGYSKTVEKSDGDLITMSSEMHIEVKRGKEVTRLTISSESTETLNGKLVSTTSMQALAAAPKTTTTVFTGDVMETTIVEGDQKQVARAPVPQGDWLAPAAADRYVRDELLKGAKEIVVKTLEDGKVATTTRKVIGNTEIQVFGRTVPAVKVETTTSVQPGVKMADYMDAEGRMLKSVISFGLIGIEQLATDKDLALSPLDGPELLLSVMVKPDRPLHGARTLANAKYRVSVAKEELPDFPTTAGQRFTRESPTGALVEQEAAGVEPVAAADYESVRAKHLVSSSMVKADDPEIVRLVKQADVQGLKSAVAAEKLREFVCSYIETKDMSVGYASASEVARTKKGDCTEHAVLLAAMLRAAGIPSRCASGLIYLNDSFGYHMWTQALVEQPDGSHAWMNYDAVLFHGVSYDASHILLSLSAMDEGDTQNFMVGMVPLLGRLKIEVVEPK